MKKLTGWMTLIFLDAMKAMINNKKIFFQIPQEQLEEIKKVENITKR